MNFYIIEYIIFILLMLLSIAFFTLMERKVLSYSQMRKSVSKNIFYGILSPALDGIKLLMKELVINIKCIKMMFMIGPLFMFIIMMVLNMFSISFYNLYSMKFYFFFLLMMFGMNIYSTMFSGWMSFCKYSMISHIRSGNQSISYEVILSLMIILFFFFYQDSNKENMFFVNMIMNYMLSFMFFMILIVEMNRTPFDFSEAESELISGFNTEHSSSLFVLLFLGEYGFLIFGSYIMMMLFFKMYYFFFLFFLFIFLIIRSSFPRYRYDMMMNFLWKSFLFNFCMLFMIMIMLF